MRIKSLIRKKLVSFLQLLPSPYNESQLNILGRAGMIHLAFTFVRKNRIEGPYLEFGSYQGTTFRIAFEISRSMGMKTHFFLFDSFQGLPEPRGVDVHPQIKKGMFCLDQESFVQLVDSFGIPRDAYTLVPGFYDETLTQTTREQLKIDKVSIVYIDCDLYESSLAALLFIEPWLQTGTVVCFDDFFIFNGDPERGEQRALKRVLSKYPHIRFVDWHLYGWSGKSFIVKRYS